MPHTLSADEALGKALAYCARQERTQQVVREKLYAWEVRGREVEAINSQLIREALIHVMR